MSDLTQISTTPVIPQLIEGVVDGVLKLIQDNIGDQLKLVQSMYPAGPLNPTLEKPRNYFVSERFKGFQTPAIYVLPTESPFRMEESQNFIYAEHRLQIVVLIEDVGDGAAERIARKAWRYARALWSAIHDRDLTDPYPITKLLVKGAHYSRLYMKAGSAQEVFRKEAWLDVLASSQEAFS